MASTLKGLWITHDSPIQAKTEIRIEAHNADADLANLLSQRIDTTSGTPAENVKLNASKIYSDNGSVALFTPDGDIEEAVKVKGYTNTLKNILTLGTDKAKSQCQLYIDSDVCLGSNCSFSNLRIRFRVDSDSIQNPFLETTDASLQIGSITFSEVVLWQMFKDVLLVDGIGLTEVKRYSFFFCKRLAEETEKLCSFSVNTNEWFTGYLSSYCHSYLYIENPITVTIANTDVFSLISATYKNICVHIAGVSGACAGQKSDVSLLPPSNLFKTTNIPDLLFNCDPFDCRPDYISGSGTLPACVTGCPYGAIKHKQTLTTSLPVDNDFQIKTISALKMARFPYEV